MRKEEACLQALFVPLAMIPGANVVRNPGAPVEVGAGDLVVVFRDGDPGEPDAEISGGGATYNHIVEVEAYACGEDRDAALDALLSAIGASVAAAGDLGGLAEHVEAQAPQEPEEMSVVGGDPVKGRIVPVLVVYDVESALS